MVIKIDISANNIPYWVVEQHIANKLNDLQTGKLDPQKLSSERGKIEETRELEERDQEVRRHEEAHKAAAGTHARGGPNYVYQTGKDGKKYAVGGSVSIDTSKEDSPEATIIKMQQVIAAAKAPAEPSGQDLKVAAQAVMTLQEAREELSDKHKAEQEDKSSASKKLDRAYKGAPQKTTFAASA